MIPGSGDPYQGLIQQGQQGTSENGYEWPAVVLAPRFGAAYDLFGNQKVIIRGGAGIFHDRMQSDTVQNLVSDPPFSKGVTLKYVRLQDLTPGLTGPSPAPKIFTYRYEAGIPTSFQWVLGTQVTLPWASSLDVSYVGQHAWNQMNPYVGIADMNAIDIGAAFQASNQDPTRAASAMPGAERGGERPHAGLPRLRGHQLPGHPLLAHVSLAADVVHAANVEGNPGRCQLDLEPLGQGLDEPRAALSARGGRPGLAAG